VHAFFEEVEVVTIRSLMDRFGYAYKGAQSRIYLLCLEGVDRATYRHRLMGSHKAMLCSLHR
jgi:hypothetical protein